MLPKVLSGFPGAVEETFLYNTLEYSISPMCSSSHEMIRISLSGFRHCEKSETGALQHSNGHATARLEGNMVFLAYQRLRDRWPSFGSAGLVATF